MFFQQAALSGLADDPACGNSADIVYELVPHDGEVTLYVRPVKAFVVFIAVKDMFQEPAVIVAQICCPGVKVLVRFQDEQAEHRMLLFVFSGVKGLGCLRPCKIIGFLHGGFPDILEGIQVAPALKGQHVIFRYAAVVANPVPFLRNKREKMLKSADSCQPTGIIMEP